jgi:NADPH2:quinone reductase
MKIVRFHAHGGPEALRIEEVAEPQPGPGAVRVRAEAIGVGVPDKLMLNGNYPWCPPLPVIPGNELAGTIDAVGDGVTRFAVGDRVYVNARELPQRGGGYVEAMCVPAEVPFALPDGVAAEQAVTMGNYQLAWLLLNRAATPQAGDSVLVHAAAGGAGSALIQLARGMGLTAFGIAGGPDKARYVAELGADGVIDRSGEDVAARVAALTGGTGVDVIYDSVGGRRFQRDFDMLAPMGTVVLFGYLGGHPDPNVYDAMRANFGKSLAMRLFSIHVYDDRPDMRRHAMEQAIAALAAGIAAPRIHATMPLDAAADAIRLLESGTVTGKIVLTP